jgi:hypothetical protein
MMGGAVSTNIEDRRGEADERNKLLFDNTAELKRLNDWLQGVTGGPGVAAMSRYGLTGAAGGGASGAAGAAGGAPGGGPRLTTIGVGNQKWQVNKEAAPALQGFLSDLQAAGAPHLTSSGGWNYRTIKDRFGRDTGRLSQHAYGGAIDVAESGFGGTIDRPDYSKIPRDFADWVRAHREEFEASERRWNIVGGERFGDLGHFEYGGPGGAGREALNRRALTPQTHKVEGSANINVNVAAPPGTRVEGKSAGLFKPIQMNRQVQMAHAAQGPSHAAGAEFGMA